MKNIFTKLIVGLLIFFGNESYAQYSVKQIDSLIDLSNHIDNLEQGIKLGEVAYKASKAINYQEGTVRALLVPAVKCSNVKHYEDAFKYAIAAEDAAIKLNNPRYLALLAALKGISYTNLGFYDDGKETLLNAIPIAKQIADPDQRQNRLGNIYTALGENRQMSKGDLRASIPYSRQAYIEYSKIKDQSKFTNIRALPTYNLGNSYLENKQYDSASFYLNKAVILANKYKEHITAEVAFNDLGQLYYEQKKYLLSKTYYQKGVTASMELKDGLQLKEAYVGLSKVYMALRENSAAQEYLQLSIKLSDSLANANKAAIQIPLGYILDYKKQQLGAARGKYLQIIFITCLLLVIVACSMFFYRYRLKKEIKLSAEKMNELVSKIELSKENQSPSKIEELKEVVQLAVSNDPAFFIKFNEFDAEFSKRLLNLAPGFVATEIEFCALLRLNFETKEIARYTKVSVRSVEAKKYRIRKKLGIPSDQDINLWMSQA